MAINISKFTFEKSHCDLVLVGQVDNLIWNRQLGIKSSLQYPILEDIFCEAKELNVMGKNKTKKENVAKFCRLEKYITFCNLSANLKHN